MYPIELEGDWKWDELPSGLRASQPDEPALRGPSRAVAGKRALRQVDAVAEARTAGDRVVPWRELAVGSRPSTPASPPAWLSEGWLRYGSPIRRVRA